MCMFATLQRVPLAEHLDVLTSAVKQTMSEREASDTSRVTVSGKQDRNDTDFRVEAAK